MSVVRGRGRTLEIAVDRALSAAVDELRAQFAQRPDFYRGSRATANLGILEPPSDDLRAFRDALAEFGITLDGISGPDVLAPVVAELDLAYLGAAPLNDAIAALPRRADPRDVQLSESARSLVADFAGARTDLARRRKTPAPISAVATARVATAPPPSSARPIPVGVSTLYHRGTLRGGQALHNLGNVVIIGDVNPGAEVVASGDVVVFGALRGVAHAGAQGDANARVIALALAPTQLRIATAIAGGDDAREAAGPEHASIVDGRIVVVPLAEAEFKKEINV